MSFIDKFKFDRKFCRAILVVAIPLMLQQLVTSSVNLIDNLMVGQLGDFAISGVASSNRFYIIANYGTNGILTTCSIFLAQYYGALNKKKMEETFNFSFLFSIIIGLLFLFVGLTFTPNIIGYFSSEPAVIDIGIRYLKIASLSFLPLAISMVMATSLRSIGNTKLPFYISAIAVLTNTFLNYCLIFGNFNFPTLGVEGAAIATLIARIVEMSIYIIAYMINDYPFKSKLSQIFDISSKLVKRIVLKALPLGLNEVLWSCGIATLFKLYSTYGHEAMGGYSIATTISDIFFVLFAGMAAATTILVAHPLGANELEKAKDNAYKLIGFSLVLSIVFGGMMFISSLIVPEFYNVSIGTKYIASSFLKTMGLLFWLYMFGTQCYFILRAGGDMKSTLFMDAGYMWLVNIPIVYCLVHFTNLNVISVYICGQLTDLLKIIIAYRLVRKEKWVLNLVIHEEVSNE